MDIPEKGGKKCKGGKDSLHWSLIKGDNVVPVPGQGTADKINFMDEKRC